MRLTRATRSTLMDPKTRSMAWVRRSSARWTMVSGRSLQERVCRALLSDRAGGSVSADERDVVPEGQELLLDRPDQGPAVAARQIGASDGAAKQDIPDKSEPPGRRGEDDAA